MSVKFPVNSGDFQQVRKNFLNMSKTSNDYYRNDNSVRSPLCVRFVRFVHYPSDNHLLFIRVLSSFFPGLKVGPSVRLCVPSLPSPWLVVSALCMYVIQCPSVPISDWLSVSSVCTLYSASLTGCQCPLYIRYTVPQCDHLWLVVCVLCMYVILCPSMLLSDWLFVPSVYRVQSFQVPIPGRRDTALKFKSLWSLINKSKKYKSLNGKCINLPNINLKSKNLKC